MVFYIIPSHIISHTWTCVFGNLTSLHFTQNMVLVEGEEWVWKWS